MRTDNAVMAQPAAVPMALLRDSRHALIVLDANGIVIEASLGSASVLGMQRSELLGRRYTDLLHSNEAAQADAVLCDLVRHHATQHGTLVFNWHRAGADATRVKVEHSFSCTTTDAGPLLLGVLRTLPEDDGSARKSRESESRFRGVMALSSDWYWEQDQEFRFTMFAGDRNDGLPSGANALIGVRRWETPGEPIGTTWEEHIAQLRAHLPFRDLIVQRTEGLADKPIIVRVHGDPIFDDAGEFVGYRGIAADVTQEKQAELAIAESEARYRALVNIAVDGIILLDESVIVFVNDTFVEMMRAPGPQQFLGRNILEFIHPDYRQSVQRRYSNLTRTRTTNEDPLLERKLLRCDGTALLVEMRGVSFSSGGRLLVQSVVRDISRYRQIEDELRVSEQRFRDIAEAAGEYVWESDAQGRYTYLSQRVVDVLGYRAEEMVGSRPSRFVPAHEAEEIAKWFDIANPRQLMFRNLEHRAVTKAGVVIWLQVSGVTFRDAAGQVAGFRGTALDVTERKLADQELQRLATHDILTGLPNRALLLDRLQQALAVAEREASKVGVLFVDLDKFKRINDLLGHAAGDELLRQAARRLADVLRDQDTLCRIGGDEFVAVLTNFGSRANLESTASRIIAAFSDAFQLSSGQFSVGASVGVSVFPDDARTADDLIRRADTAVYHAKAQGGGQLAIYSSALGPGTDERLRFELELRRAIVEREFRVYLQPIFAVNTGRLSGAEALIRWQHPQRGLLLPGRFVAAAEAANLISALGDWMLNEVATQLGEWQCQGRPPIRVSVNVSMQQLATGLDFIEHLESVISRYQIAPACLVLEVTESLLVQSIDAVSATLRAARALGVRIAMDDFGTGYSSLHLLRHLPIDIIKVDRAFVHYLKRENKDLAVLTAIVGLARAFELEVVAEGVEQQAQADLLCELGFDSMQGFLFAEPMPVDDFTRSYLSSNVPTGSVRDPDKEESQTY